MRTVIQSKRNHLYFDLEHEMWVQLESATHFESATDALRMCLRKGLLDVQLLVQAGDRASEYDFVVPFQ